MPAYKYQLKTGKTKWYANFYYEAPNSINANVVLIRRKKPMNMKDCSWISFQRALLSCSLPLLTTIWMI